MDTGLLLHEELLLLALNDEEGSGRSDLALGGGLLTELVFHGAIEIETNRRKSKVRVVEPAPPIANELLAECRQDIADSKKERGAEHWVSKFSTKKDLKHRVAEPLVAKGIVSEKQSKLLFITITRYPELDPRPEADMTERLRVAIEHHDVTPSERTVALLAIGNSASLLANNFDKKLLRSQKKRIEELSKESVTSEAVQAGIEGVQTAMILLMTSGTT